MQGANLRRWQWLHKWTSLVCAAFMLLLCVTGLPLIFYEEIDRALGYRVAPPALDEPAGRLGPDPIVAHARAEHPDEVVQFLVRDREHPELWFVRLGETIDAPGASSFLTYDARTGALLNSYPLNQGPMHVLLRLHVDLFAGLPGKLLLGFMGLMLFASLVSGAMVYAPYARRLRRGGDDPAGRSRRVIWLDLHNLIGIVTLAWLSVVTLTGVVNTLAGPIFDQWQRTQLAEMTRPYRDREPPRDAVPVGRALAAARRAAPDMQLSFMAFPGNDFASPGHYMAFMQGTSALTANLLRPVMIDARTAEVAASRTLPWYVTTLLLSQPLHFGNYGGLPLKALWALLDVLAIVVLASGIYLWLVRRGPRATRESAPGRRRP